MCFIRHQRALFPSSPPERRGGGIGWPLQRIGMAVAAVHKVILCIKKTATVLSFSHTEKKQQTNDDDDDEPPGSWDHR
jgi:hypothetical protein